MINCFVNNSLYILYFQKMHFLNSSFNKMTSRNIAKDVSINGNQHLGNTCKSEEQKHDHVINNDCCNLNSFRDCVLEEYNNVILLNSHAQYSRVKHVEAKPESLISSKHNNENHPQTVLSGSVDSCKETSLDVCSILHNEGATDNCKTLIIESNNFIEANNLSVQHDSDTISQKILLEHGNGALLALSNAVCAKFSNSSLITNDNLQNNSYQTNNHRQNSVEHAHVIYNDYQTAPIIFVNCQSSEDHTYESTFANNQSGTTYNEVSNYVVKQFFIKKNCKIGATRAKNLNKISKKY